MGVQHFQNVIHAEVGDRWGEILEGRYLESFFKELQALDPEMFRTFRFLIVNQNTRFGPPRLPFSGQDVILIWLSDEQALVPNEGFSSRFKLILKSYWPLREGLRNILPFPLCGASEVLRTEPVDWAIRRNKIFFSGNLNANRVDFFRQFNRLRNLPPRDLPFYWQRRLYWEVLLRWPFPYRRDFSELYPNSHIVFTNRFRAGVPPKDYAQSLAQSCIAICPPGFTSAETIRHFEAMRLGCVIISSPLPPNPFYAGSPIIVLDRWRSLDGCLSALLATAERVLEKKSKETFQWWQSRASPCALANCVFRHLISR